MMSRLQKFLLLAPLALFITIGLTASPYVSEPAEAQSRKGKKVTKKVKKNSARAKRSARNRRRAAKRSRARGKSASSSRQGKSGSRKSGGKLLQTFKDWSTYEASLPTRTCYAASQPIKREPGRLKRDPGYFLISTRPRQGVRNEVAIIAGFAAKAGSEPEIRIRSERFALVSNGPNLWIKNAAEERPLLAAMRKGARMTVHITSARGNKTVDTYSLSGLTQALARARKACR